MYDVEAIRQAFSKRAINYDDYAHMQREVRGETALLAKQFLPPDARLLDAGCGTGASIHDLRAAGFSGDMTALDFSVEMCVHAKKNYACVINATAEMMPFADASFDAVFSTLMLQWVDDPIVFFKETARILTHGGYAIIATLTEGTLGELRRAFSALDSYHHTSQFLSPEQFASLIAEAGFEQIHMKTGDKMEYYPYLRTIMHAMQTIGATNKRSDRKRGLMTPRQFKLLEQEYEKMREKLGLPLTWRITTFVLKKI